MLLGLSFQWFNTLAAFDQGTRLILQGHGAHTRNAAACEKGVHGTHRQLRERHDFLVLERSSFVVSVLKFLGNDPDGWDASIIYNL